MRYVIKFAGILMVSWLVVWQLGMAEETLLDGEVRMCANGKRSYFGYCPEDVQTNDSRPPEGYTKPQVVKETKRRPVDTGDCDASRPPEGGENPCPPKNVPISPSVITKSEGCRNIWFWWQFGPQSVSINGVGANNLNICYIDLDATSFTTQLDFIPLTTTQDPNQDGISGFGTLNGSNIHWGSSNCSNPVQVSRSTCHNKGDYDSDCAPVLINGKPKSGIDSGTVTLRAKAHVQYLGNDGNVLSEGDINGKVLTREFSGCVR